MKTTVSKPVKAVSEHCKESYFSRARTLAKDGEKGNNGEGPFAHPCACIAACSAVRSRLLKEDGGNHGTSTVKCVLQFDAPSDFGSVHLQDSDTHNEEHNRSNELENCCLMRDELWFKKPEKRTLTFPELL